MQCNNCGAENRDDARFCCGCGNPLHAVGGQQTPKVSVLILVVVSVAALCAIALIVVIKSSGNVTMNEASKVPVQSDVSLEETEPVQNNVSSRETEPEPSKDETKLEDGEPLDGAYVLSGRVHIHDESVNNQQVTVVSMTLDKPIDYTYEYKGTVSATANEVELETSLSDDFGQWTSYDGRHITVACDSLHGAIHDASMHGVDTLAMGRIRLLGTDD